MFTELSTSPITSPTVLDPAPRRSRPSIHLARGLLALFTGRSDSHPTPDAVLEPARRRSRPHVRFARGLLAVLIGLLCLVYLVVPVALAVVATHPVRNQIAEPTPADLGLSYRDVTFETSDGVRLAGWYIPSRNGAAVLAAPGAGETRSGVLEAAVVLGRHGFGVLALDHRGHGLSGGTAMDFGWFGERDVDAAITFLADQPDVDPARIGALGFSMGGEEVLTAAAADPRIKAVVSDGGTHRVFEDLHAVMGRTWLQTVLVPFYWVSTHAPRVMTSATPPIPLPDAVGRIAPRRVLLISADEERESALSRHLQSMAPASTSLWVVADTSHTQAIRTHPAEWSARVLAFFAATLA